MSLFKLWCGLCNTVKNKYYKNEELSQREMTSPLFTLTNKVQSCCWQWLSRNWTATQHQWKLISPIPFQILSSVLKDTYPYVVPISWSSMFLLNLIPFKFIFSELLFKMLQSITGLPIIKQLFPFQLCKFKTLRKHYPNWKHVIASHLQHSSLLEDTKTKRKKRSFFFVSCVPSKFCQTIWWIFCSLFNWSESK